MNPYLFLTLMSAAAEQLGKNLANKITKSKFETEVREALSAILDRLKSIEDELIRLPDLVAAEIMDAFRADREAEVTSYKPQVDDIVSGGDELTEDQRRQLIVILVEVKAGSERLWRFGPVVYHTAAFGTLMAIAIHRLVGSPDSEVENFIDQAATKRFGPLADPTREDALAYKRDRLAERETAARNYLLNYPREAAIDVFLRRGNVAYQEPDIRQLTDMIVKPDGIPEAGNRYYDAGRGKTYDRGGARFPDVLVNLTGQNDEEKRGNAERVISYMNAKLDEYRKIENDRVVYDAMVTDSVAFTARIRAIAGPKITENDGTETSAAPVP